MDKELKKIKKVWGINAYEKIMDILYKQQLRIEELIKSRENHKNNVEKLKQIIKEIKNEKKNTMNSKNHIHRAGNPIQ